MNTVVKINLLILAIFLSSCNSHYFDKSIPTDSKDLTEFPVKFRGKWLISGETSTAWDTLIIEKYFFKIKSSENKQFKISKHEIDSAGTYCLSPTKIYEIREKHLIGEGAVYFIRNDTIYFTHIEDFKIYEINRECILKKADKYLIINIKGDDNKFWTPILLQKDNQGLLVARVMSQKEMNPLVKAGNLKQIYANGQNYFYEIQLTEKETINIIENNGFVDTLSIWKPLKKH
ncbi:MAG: hypothetical protein Q8928_04915 [Bacteroidota bacterium]|nr:hypothetical protein [Bacteroidota bacterium]